MTTYNSRGQLNEQSESTTGGAGGSFDYSNATSQSFEERFRRQLEAHFPLTGTYDQGAEAVDPDNTNYQTQRDAVSPVSNNGREIAQLAANTSSVQAALAQAQADLATAQQYGDLQVGAADMQLLEAMMKRASGMAFPPLALCFAAAKAARYCATPDPSAVETADAAVSTTGAANSAAKLAGVDLLGAYSSVPGVAGLVIDFANWSSARGAIEAQVRRGILPLRQIAAAAQREYTALKAALQQQLKQNAAEPERREERVKAGDDVQLNISFVIGTDGRLDTNGGFQHDAPRGVPLSVVTGLKAELRRHINSGQLDFMPGEPYRATLNGKLRYYGGKLHLIREGKLHIVRQKG